MNSGSVAFFSERQRLPVARALRLQGARIGEQKQRSTRRFFPCWASVGCLASASFAKMQTRPTHELSMHCGWWSKNERDIFVGALRLQMNESFECKAQSHCSIFKCRAGHATWKFLPGKQIVAQIKRFQTGEGNQAFSIRDCVARGIKILKRIEHSPKVCQGLDKIVAEVQMNQSRGWSQVGTWFQQVFGQVQDEQIPKRGWSNKGLHQVASQTKLSDSCP